MAKRILLDIHGVRLNETSYKLLGCIAGAARGKHGLACVPVALSRRSLAAQIDCSTSNVIRSCRALEEQGLIVVTVNNLQNGAQTKNNYALTALGIEALRLADEAVAAGKVGATAAGATRLHARDAGTTVA